MSAKTLEALIRLRGNVDSSVGRLSSTLMNLHAQLDALGEKALGFSKDSLVEYMEYDDIMRRVQAAGEYSNQQMADLDSYNKSIAKTSKFTMDQAAGAEMLMVQLGMDIDQAKSLMPTVMDMATAAEIPLADSLDYIFFSLNALGMPLEDARLLSDQLAKAAAESATDIDTMGLALQRLGSGAQFFTGGSSEVLALLSAMSKYGQDMQGAPAGTQLRNFMLTLLAPTKSKAEIIAKLGVSDEDWAEFETYLEDMDIDLKDAAGAMEAMGLQIYDAATGELRPTIDIMTDMRDALDGMSESEQNKVLGSLFGKRTTITAKNLLTILDEAIRLQKIIEGESEGYTEYVADLQEGGIGGAQRMLESAHDLLKTAFGQQMAPEATVAMESLQKFLTFAAELDPAIINGVAGSIETFGIAIGGLGILGAGSKVIAFATAGSGLALLGIGAATAAVGFAAWNDAAAKADFENTFGTMDLNTQPLTDYVNSITTEFGKAYTEVNKYNEAVAAAVTGYTDASTALSGKLVEKVITGTEITDEETKQFVTMGQTMAESVISGYEASFSSSRAYLKMLFGDDANNEAYQNMLDVTNYAETHLFGEVRKIGEEFGEVLGTAMDDGIITGGEYEAIREKMDAYNQAMAEIQNREEAGEMAAMMGKAQGVSWESVGTFLADTNAKYEQMYAQAQEEHWRQRGKLEYDYDKAIADRKATKADKEAALKEFDEGQDDFFSSYADRFANIAIAAFDTLFAGTEHQEGWNIAKRLAGNGGLKFDENGNIITNATDHLSADEAEAFRVFLDSNNVHSILGFLKGEKNYTPLLEPYADNQIIGNLLHMFASGKEVVDWVKGDVASAQRRWNEAAYKEPIDLIYRLEELLDNPGSIGEKGENFSDAYGELSAGFKEEAESIVEYLKSQFNFGQVLKDAGVDPNAEYADMFAAYQLMFGSIRDISFSADNYRLGNQTNVAIAEAEGKEYQTFRDTLQTAADEQPITQKVEVTDDGDAAALRSLIENTYGKPVVQVVSIRTNSNNVPWTGNSHEGGGDGTGNIGGGTGALGTAMGLYAEGGRATEASIFGEAGAEWAIPERHTARTAELLTEAARASGFSWPELYNLSTPSARSTQLVYSPTIIANDARGVEAKLRDDKERLEKWWRDKQVRERVEVYA